MKIEAGKYYRTRDGRKIGPMCWDAVLSGWRKLTGDIVSGDYWYEDGSRYGHCIDGYDLISEWPSEPVTIQVGGYYQFYDGRNIGPLIVGDRFVEWKVKDGDSYSWYSTSFLLKNVARRIDTARSDDPTGPIRTVTRKEIVPGTYGRIVVGKTYTVPDCNSPDDKPMPMVDLWAHERGYTASELRAAAATMIELADALDEL